MVLGSEHEILNCTLKSAGARSTLHINARFTYFSALLMLDKIRFVQYVLEINNKAVEEPGESEKNWR